MAFDETSTTDDVLEGVRLDGKHALVTGATGGLGIETARALASVGASVTIGGRDPQKIDSALATLREQVPGASFDAIEVDLASLSSIASATKAFVDTGRTIDLLINNAGVIDRNASLSELDVDTVEWILDVNVLGPMRVTQALLANLSAGKRKTVVNISSRLGSLAQNGSGGLYGYRESKVALNMFTVSLANEFRDEGFIAVAMNPGWVQTDMGGENAALTPEQSVSGMRSVIEGLTLDDSGTFRAHSGGQEPW